jgi:hypothetical protein
MWVARTRAVQRAFAAHAPERRLLVRYEAVRADPDGTLRDLDRWLDLPRTTESRREAIRWNNFDTYPEDAKGQGKPLRAAQPGLWQTNLSVAEQAIMHEVMGPVLAELGYDDTAATSSS